MLQRVRSRRLSAVRQPNYASDRGFSDRSVFSSKYAMFSHIIWNRGRNRSSIAHINAHVNEEQEDAERYRSSELFVAKVPTCTYGLASERWRECHMHERLFPLYTRSCQVMAPHTTHT
jgi:hypothetical protein